MEPERSNPLRFARGLPQEAAPGLARNLLLRKFRVLQATRGKLACNPRKLNFKPFWLKKNFKFYTNWDDGDHLFRRMPLLA